MGDLQQAKEHHERALDIGLKKRRPEQVDVATSRNKLSVVQRDLSDLRQAKKHRQRALDKQLETLGPDDAEVGQTSTKLGVGKHDLVDLKQVKGTSVICSIY